MNRDLAPAVVVLGGLLTSTFLNMMVVPALFMRYGKLSAESARRRCGRLCSRM